MSEKLLDVQDCRTYFFTHRGIVKAVDGVSFNVKQGESVGLVGESGCGKTVTCLSILRLVPLPGKIMGGSVYFKGENLLGNEKRIKEVRGAEISMIFQDPLSSLNPLIKVGEQVAEVIRVHHGLDKKEAWDKAVRMIESVGISESEERAKQYPFQFSGGMRQRIMIAIALSCRPDLLIADEPTTNLDVTIQAQIIESIKKITEEMNTSLLLITHNLSLIAWLCSKVNVMYAGKIFEQGSVKSIFKNPINPYTRALFRTIPRVDTDIERLESIKGNVPDLINVPRGCRFYPRCLEATEICSKREPQLTEVEPGHFVRCFLRK